MVQRVKPALVREREPAMLEKKKWNETAKRSEGGTGTGDDSAEARTDSRVSIIRPHQTRALVRLDISHVGLWGSTLI